MREKDEEFYKKVGENIHNRSNEDWHELARSAKDLGDAHLQNGETELARKAFFSAISITCKIVPGTKENCDEIASYLMLAAQTYFQGSLDANQRSLIFVADNFIVYANNINMNELYGYLAYLINPYSGIYNNLLSDVLLPVLSFIYSNHPCFQNRPLRKPLHDFLSYLTHSQNNPKLLTQLYLNYIQMNHDHNIITTLEDMLEKQQKIITSLRQDLININSGIINRENTLEKQQKVITSLQRDLIDMNSVIIERENSLEKQEETIKLQEATIEYQRDIINEQHRKIEEIKEKSETNKLAEIASEPEFSSYKRKKRSSNITEFFDNSTEASSAKREESVIQGIPEIPSKRRKN